VVKRLNLKSTNDDCFTIFKRARWFQIRGFSIESNT